MSQIDLISLFQEVTKTLQANQQSLNEADTYNKNHGDNMVQTFETITKAAKQSKAKTPSGKLAAASKALSNSQSGSAKIYAQGLQKASQDFKGKELNSDNVGVLIESLMGMGADPQVAKASSTKVAPASGQGDLLGSLLGSLLNQGRTQPEPEPQAGGGDLLGDLLGGLLGGGQPQQQTRRQAPQQSSDDLGDLLGGLLGGSQPQQQTRRQAPKEGSDDLGDMLDDLLGSGQQQQQTRRQSPQQAPDGLGDLLGELLGGGQQQQQTRRQSPQQAPDGLGDLLGELLGGGQQQPQTRRQAPQQNSGGDLLGDLLGGLLGGGSTRQAEPEPSSPSGDLLDQILGGGSSKTSSRSKKSQGLDLGSLLSAGLAYYMAKKGGRSSLEAIMAALTKSSPLGNDRARTQSGALIIDTILGMLKG